MMKKIWFIVAFASLAVSHNVCGSAESEAVRISRQRSADTISVLTHALRQLKAGQPVDAIETLSSAVQISRGGGTSIDESIITPFAGDLIGAGNLYREFYNLRQLYSEVFDKDVGLRPAPEAMDSIDRMRMVAAIKIFVESPISYGIEFYNSISGIYHNPSSTEHEKKHCLAF
ncbi:MAG: hypothetical protein K2X98_03780 [Alphaproteobacteria bacterium]|nr:hypothetical protein [Alphaproteobacteria bacterium]